MLRFLLQFYPRSLRNRERDLLLEAFRSCIDRERARSGALGTTYAWIALFIDAAVNGLTR